MRDRWWDRERVKDKLRILSAIWARVDNRSSGRRVLEMRDLIHEAIYHGRPMAERGREVVSLVVSTANPGRTLNINIAQTKTDAITSRMSKHRIYPVIAVQGAPYTEGRHATAATEQLRARLKTAAVIRAKPRTLRGALIHGTSAMGVRAEGGDVVVESIPRREILVGDKDGETGDPRSFLRVQNMALEVACHRWPKAWRELERHATPQDQDDILWQRTDNDDLRVTVVTAHHLPSGPGADDGRVTVCTRDILLEDREWTRAGSPYAFWNWIPATTGFWGQGLVEILASVQAEISDTARSIRENLRWGSSLTVFKPRGSEIPNEHLVGLQPRVVEFEGQTPQYVAPMPVSPQLFQYFERMIALADDLSGLARDYSTGQTQLGARASGRAVQMLDDIQSDRFAAFQFEDSAAMLDLGQAMLDEARDLDQRKRDGELEGVKLADWIKDFDWKRVDPRKGYKLQFEAENFLPSSRGGRLAAIDEMGATGLISDPDAILDAFQEPDAQRLLHDKLGARRAIQYVMGALHDFSINLYDLVPGANFPIKRGIVAAQNEWNNAFAAGADPALLERIDQWIQLAKKKDEAANAAKPAPAGAPGAMPGDPAMGLPPGADPGMMPPGMDPGMADPLAAIPEGLAVGGDPALSPGMADQLAAAAPPLP